jgi:tRNA modification GTPase
METDTIAAVATPAGTGAIGVVRMSGADAADVLYKVFSRKTLRPRRMTHGYIVRNGETVDEVMCVFLPAPHTYTREDTVEIFTHGGPSAVQGVLRALLSSGARPAEPGAFTKRAFLNGRIDLTQAEAVMDVITASHDSARRAGLRKLSGGFSFTIARFRDEIIRWLAHIELSIDYPEHEAEAMNLTAIHTEGVSLLARMDELLKTAIIGRYIAAGIPTVIAGKPNVGKSSLLNAILQRDRAIVSDAPGTTRDTLTESVTVRDVPLRITDTAGIRASADAVEQSGVARSTKAAQHAELVLFVLDRSQPPTEEDFAVYDLIKNQRHIIIHNKSDLPSHGPSPFDETAIPVSATTGAGLDALYQAIAALFFGGGISAEADLITHARHEYQLSQAVTHIRDALAAIEAKVPEDLTAVHLHAAARALGEILGLEVGEDVLDRIFAEFCVGK